MKFDNKTPLEPKPLRKPPITIAPAEVKFEDVSSNNCYESGLTLRNEGKQTQKIRLIPPTSRHFRLKTEDGLIRSIAPGLSLKLILTFSIDKMDEQKMFEDKLFIIGDAFKETVSLKAFAPHQKFLIPATVSLGRLLVGRQNTAVLQIKNEGRKHGEISCELPPNSINSLVNYHLKLSAGETGKVQLKLRNKKAGPYTQRLSFSNGSTCILNADFINESVDILNADGEPLTCIDLGQILIGEKVQEQFFLANNTEKKVECIFKTFHRNVEPSDVKVDFAHGNFVSKTLPEDYAKQLSNCHSQTTVEKATVQPYSQLSNCVVINKRPSLKEVKAFYSYATGSSLQQIHEQPIIETLILRTSHSKNTQKIPIKFISVFPRLRIDAAVLEYGQVRVRTDSTKQVTLQNEGDKDIQVKVQPTENVKVQGSSIIKAHSSQKFTVNLRAVRAGKIHESVHFRISEGLEIEVKVFGVCRGSSIRAKKISNMKSARSLQKDFALHESLGSLSPSAFNETRKSEAFNCTDTLAELRVNRKRKLMQEQMISETEPILPEPLLNLLPQNRQLKMSRDHSLRKLTRLGVFPLNSRQIDKISRVLSAASLGNILLNVPEVSFGNVFIDTELVKEVKVTNKNEQPILFEWDTSGNATLKNTNCALTKIEAGTTKTFRIVFKPNSLGTVSLPLGYVINRHHSFELPVTAFVTLINVGLSTKIIELSFSPDDIAFQKSQSFQVFNTGNTPVRCQLKFQQGKHFQVSSDTLQLQANNSQKVEVIYRPVEGQELSQERTDTDKLIVKVVNGAESFIKCSGTVNEARVTVKETELCYGLCLACVPMSGKLNIKNCSKVQTSYKIELLPELKDMISFEKESSILGQEQKKQICFSILCQEPRKVSSHILVHIRGSRTMKIPFQATFTVPEVLANRAVIDFGNIPIMGSFSEQLLLTNLYRHEIKLQLSKKFDTEDYTIEVRQTNHKTEQEPQQLEIKSKKKGLGKDESRDKKTTAQKYIKLPPNVETSLEVKFIPKRLQQFEVPLPLRLLGTSGNPIEPVSVRLLCQGIEPVVYLHPQRIQFSTHIIGEGKSSFMKSFSIKNPHDFDIDWRIEPVQSDKAGSFYLSENRGKLSSGDSVLVEVIFKPQQEGHFCERLDVVLRERKVSHISLELEGSAILPSIKFNCNELLMPLVPLAVQSRASLVLENHGYDAITIGKWKTSAHFPAVDMAVSFVEGKLLSLAKKNLRVEVVCVASSPISFTTMLEFYDQFGNRYEVPLSFTADNSLMTVYPFTENEPNTIVLDRKEGLVRLQSSPGPSEQALPTSTKHRLTCELIKNWLNYELSLGIKQFPQCLIDSEGDLFSRMVNRMSGVELLRKFEGAANDNFPNSIAAYYYECIRILKTEGAFLNQLRPEFMLHYRDYKACLNSRNLLVESEKTFEATSLSAWTAIFYQLCKLYILPQVTDKMVGKKATLSTSTTLTPPLTSNIYSTQEMIVFRFLNSFANDQPLYNLANQVRFMQILQRSLERCFGLNYASSLAVLKASVPATPSQLAPIISKFLHQKLKQFGLSLYLNETDLSTMGPKELLLFLVSYIGMIYHFNNAATLTFEASIGDKIIKIIEVDNPVSRKVKYRLKMLGSPEFHIEQQQLSMGSKGKAEIRVSYQCKQNKEEEGKLLLLPAKEDNAYVAVQPMAFHLCTSILSKITLRKIQISTYLYEVTPIPLDVELPIDTTEFSQFTVSIDELSTTPNYHCFQPLNRTLRNNRDRLDIRLVPLTPQTKFCRVCYRSPIFGEFNFQITAKIQTPPILKEIRLKQFKVGREQSLSISIPRQNQLLAAALKFLNEHHCKIDLPTTTRRTIPLNKYTASIVESSYISIVEDSSELTKTQPQKGETMRVDLKCSFGKPFAEYSCTLMVRNDLMKDIRYYKLITSVAMKPKLVSIEVKIKARESTIVRIPIKCAPCELTLDNPIEQFSFNNYPAHLKQNTELVATFAPEWMMERTVTLTADNKESLEQTIYQISLIAQEPAYFETIRIEASAVFKKRLKLSFNLNTSEQLNMVCTSKRIQLEGDGKFTPNRKWVMATVLPSHEEEQTYIKFFRQKNGQYYWASLLITNRTVQKLPPLTIEEKPSNRKTLLLQTLALGQDYQVHCEQTLYLEHRAVTINGLNRLQFIFHPVKEMEAVRRVALMVASREYSLEVQCKAPTLPTVFVPEIYTRNLAEKTTTVNLINPSELTGTYKATIEPAGIFTIESWQIQIKEHQKKEISVQFKPLSLQVRYKAMVRFESETLPTYEYQLTAISEFDNFEEEVACEYWSDRQSFKQIYFTNHFAKTEKFQIESSLAASPFALVEPLSKTIQLQPGATRTILLKARGNKADASQGKVIIKMRDKSWVYRLVPLEIKNCSLKKYTWNCKARQTYYQTIDLPEAVLITSLQSHPELAPYLSFTLEENTQLRLKYTPLKPLPKKQYQILLIGGKSKFMVSCLITVREPDFDDTIIIRTKEINEVACVSFKLTNISKQTVPFRAYLLNAEPDLSVQTEKGVLQGYGRTGTTIAVSFASNVYNRRAEDELRVQTAQMMWRFKVRGVLTNKPPQR